MVTIKTARKLRNGLLIAGFVIMLSAYLYEPLFLVGTVVTISCLIPHFLWNKCPRCRKQLGRSDGEYCQHCGFRLDD